MELQCWLEERFALGWPYSGSVCSSLSHPVPWQNAFPSYSDRLTHKSTYSFPLWQNEPECVCLDCGRKSKGAWRTKTLKPGIKAQNLLAWRQLCWPLPHLRPVLTAQTQILSATVWIYCIHSSWQAWRKRGFYFLGENALKNWLKVFQMLLTLRGNVLLSDLLWYTVPPVPLHFIHYIMHLKASPHFWL